MIHEKLLEELIRERRRKSFIYPWYGRYSIAELAPTVATLFGGTAAEEVRRATLPAELWSKYQGTKKVVLFLVDGFAWTHLIKYYGTSPFLSRLVERGDVYPLTSVFPSTTPAALTSIHTGLTPQEHGLPEWTVFFEEIDAIIETLPFRLLMTGGRDTLLQTGGDAAMLYDGPTLYQQLSRARVDSYVFQYFEYANSAYSHATQKGAYAVSYANIVDLMTKLREHLERIQGPAYFFVYWGSIDSVMHQFGPHTREHITELGVFADTVERELLSKLTPQVAQDTVALLSADHGQANVERGRIIYLNQYLPLESYYQRSKKQKAIVPTGGPHDVFLFITPKNIEDTIGLLTRELDGKATVLRTEEAIAQGLFGVGEPTSKFLRRVGNVLVLPHANHHIWYEHMPNTPFKQLGCHGGLSEEEMIVPLAIAPLSALLP